MLSQKERIPKALFDEYSRKTKAFPTNLFILRAHFLKDGNSRFSVVVSKKVAKKSVDRHYIKRAIYEILRNYTNIWPKGYYFIFVNKMATKEEYKTEMEKIKKVSI